MTLLQRVLILALPALITVCSLSGWVGIGWAESNIGNRSKIMLEDFVALQVEKLKDELQLSRSQLRLIANEPGVIAAARGSIAGENLFLKLVEAQNNHPAFSELEVFSVNNIRVASVADTQELPRSRSGFYLAELNRGAEVFDLHTDNLGRHLIIAQTIRDDGRTVGMLTARIQIDAFQDIINARHNGMTTVETLWITKGPAQLPRLVSTPHLIDSSTANARLNDGALGKLAGRSLRGVHTFVDSIDDYRDEPVMAVSSYSPVTGWGLVAKIDRSEVYSTLSKFQAFTLLSTIVTSLLCLAAMALVLRNVTQPLKTLTQEAIALARLDDDSAPLPGSKNELEILQEVHIRMRQRVTDEQARLKTEVELQTNNLRNANEQLVDLNSVLIDAQNRAEQNEARLQLAMKASLAGVWEWRRDDRDRVWMSRRCIELLKLGNESNGWLDIAKFTALLDSDDGNFSAEMTRTLKKERVFQCSLPAWKGTDKEHWFKLVAAAELNEDGSIEHVAGSITDIQALKDSEHEVHQLVVALEERASTDAMTGLANRRYFNETLDEELARAKRYKNTISAIVIDADHFKKINDKHGHLTGDDVLVTLAREIQQICRPTDFACRFGGEEFVVLMPETDLAGAAKFSERLRKRIEDLRVRNKNGDAVPVTVSIGVTEWLPGERGEDLIQRADICVYQAKARGRNRVYKSPASVSESILQGIDTPAKEKKS